MAGRERSVFSYTVDEETSRPDEPQNVSVRNALQFASLVIIR